MVRILYLMHVPWGWIKQRPHFLAEYLAKDFAVDVYYKKPILVHKRHLLTQENITSNLSIRGFKYIPLNKIPVVKYLKLDFVNRFLLHYQLPDFAEYDYIWFTCPSLYLLFSERLKPTNRIIYDCMDDMLEFSFCKNNVLLASKMLDAERELLQKSDIVFCSSDYLKNKILSRTGISRNVVTLNNAVELPHLEGSSVTNGKTALTLSKIRKLSHPLLYIGTISEWFDFNLLIKVLGKYRDVNLVLAGPTNTEIPSHPQIHYIGTVSRDDIFALMSTAWCLVMPFQVNELIRSVNPVKLYEYIYAGKPVIAPRYGETIKFSPYVELYESEEDFFDIVEKYVTVGSLPENKRKEMIDFARHNTWGDRYQIVKKELVL